MADTRSNQTANERRNYETSRFFHNVRIVANRALNRLYMGKGDRGEVVEAFHKLYYDTGTLGKTWSETYWMGARVAKCPMDLWLYQELLFDLRPDLIVECGTLYGGSASYLASICDLIDNGQILSIDVRPREGRPEHDRVTYLTGSSVAPAIVEVVKDAATAAGTVMVILDSDHRKDHVLQELRTYAPVVTVGSLLVVEDTNLNGNPVAPEFGPGPMEALNEFLAERDDFEIDERGNKFYLSFNPRGYLRKLK